MPNEFKDLGVPTATTKQDDLRTVAHSMRHLIMFGDAALTTLRQFVQDYSRSELLTELNATQENKVRRYWAVIQALGDAQDPPVSVPDLPAP